MKVRSAIAIAVLLFAAPGAGAQESAEYARAGREAWSGFQCSIFASYAKEGDEEQARLFQYGYERGQFFLEAANEGKIEGADINSNVPIGITMRMQGPSLEFILGRIFEAAADDAADKVYENDARDDFLVMQARNLYTERNCGLIGQ